MSDGFGPTSTDSAANPVSAALQWLAAPGPKDVGLRASLQTLGHSPALRRLGAMPVQFRAPPGEGPFTHLHPQSMVRDPQNGRLYIAAVDILEQPDRENATHGGRGRGYLFELDPQGQPLRTVRLSAEGDPVFHPGGMVIQGGALIVPVAEYRKTGGSRVMRVPLDTLEPEQLFRIGDHVGAVSVDPKRDQLHLFTWDSAEHLVADRTGKLLSRAPNPTADRMGWQDAQLLSDGSTVLSGVSPGGGKRFGVDVMTPEGEISGPSLRWTTSAHRTPEGFAPLGNPSLSFTDPAGRVLVLANPDTPTPDGRGELFLYELEPEARATEDHHADYGFLLDASGPEPLEDTVLPRLIAGGLAVPAEAAADFEVRYASAVAAPIDDPAARAVIGLHRRMLRSEAYVDSRLDDRTTGTLDHLHAELCAARAVELARRAGYPQRIVELVRLAGHLHDSDRSFPELMTRGEDAARGDPDAYRRFKTRHMEHSVARAKDLVTLARQAGAELTGAQVDDLVYLVGRHELGGGDGDGAGRKSRVDPSVSLGALADLVRDADSMSFFDANVVTYWDEVGHDEQRLASKVHYMFDRLGPEAQAAVREQVTRDAAAAKDSGLKLLRGLVAAALA